MAQEGTTVSVGGVGRRWSTGQCHDEFKDESQPLAPIRRGSEPGMSVEEVKRTMKQLANAAVEVKARRSTSIRTAGSECNRPPAFKKVASGEPAITDCIASSVFATLQRELAHAISRQFHVMVEARATASTSVRKRNSSSTFSIRRFSRGGDRKNLSTAAPPEVLQAIEGWARILAHVENYLSYAAVMKSVALVEIESIVRILLEWLPQDFSSLPLQLTRDSNRQHSGCESDFFSFVNQIDGFDSTDKEQRLMVCCVSDLVVSDLLARCMSGYDGRGLLDGTVSRLIHASMKAQWPVNDAAYVPMIFEPLRSIVRLRWSLVASSLSGIHLDRILSQFNHEVAAHLGSRSLDASLGPLIAYLGHQKAIVFTPDGIATNSARLDSILKTLRALFDQLLMRQSKSKPIVFRVLLDVTNRIFFQIPREFFNQDFVYFFENASQLSADSSLKAAAMQLMTTIMLRSDDDFMQNNWAPFFKKRIVKHVFDRRKTRHCLLIIIKWLRGGDPAGVHPYSSGIRLHDAFAIRKEIQELYTNVISKAVRKPKLFSIYQDYLAEIVLCMAVCDLEFTSERVIRPLLLHSKASSPEPIVLGLLVLGKIAHKDGSFALYASQAEPNRARGDDFRARVEAVCSNLRDLMAQVLRWAIAAVGVDAMGSSSDALVVVPMTSFDGGDILLATRSPGYSVDWWLDDANSSSDQASWLKDAVRTVDAESPEHWSDVGSTTSFATSSFVPSQSVAQRRNSVQKMQKALGSGDKITLTGKQVAMLAKAIDLLCLLPLEEPLLHSQSAVYIGRQLMHCSWSLAMAASRSMQVVCLRHPHLVADIISGLVCAGSVASAVDSNVYMSTLLRQTSTILDNLQSVHLILPDAVLNDVDSFAVLCLCSGSSAVRRDSYELARSVHAAWRRQGKEDRAHDSAFSSLKHDSTFLSSVRASYTSFVSARLIQDFTDLEFDDTCFDSIAMLLFGDRPIPNLLLGIVIVELGRRLPINVRQSVDSRIHSRVRRLLSNRVDCGSASTDMTFSFLIALALSSSPFSTSAEDLEYLYANSDETLYKDDTGESAMARLMQLYNTIWGIVFKCESVELLTFIVFAFHSAHRSHVAPLVMTMKDAYPKKGGIIDQVIEFRFMSCLVSLSEPSRLRTLIAARARLFELCTASRGKKLEHDCDRADVYTLWAKFVENMCKSVCEEWLPEKVRPVYRPFYAVALDQWPLWERAVICSQLRVWSEVGARSSREATDLLGRLQSRPTLQQQQTAAARIAAKRHERVEEAPIEVKVVSPHDLEVLRSSSMRACVAVFQLGPMLSPQDFLQENWLEWGFECEIAGYPAVVPMLCFNTEASACDVFDRLYLSLKQSDMVLAAALFSAIAVQMVDIHQSAGWWPVSRLFAQDTNNELSDVDFDGVLSQQWERSSLDELPMPETCVFALFYLGFDSRATARVALEVLARICELMPGHAYGSIRKGAGTSIRSLRHMLESDLINVRRARAVDISKKVAALCPDRLVAAVQRETIFRLSLLQGGDSHTSRWMLEALMPWFSALPLGDQGDIKHAVIEHLQDPLQITKLALNEGTFSTDDPVLAQLVLQMWQELCGNAELVHKRAANVELVINFLLDCNCHKRLDEDQKLLVHNCVAVTVALFEQSSDAVIDAIMAKIDKFSALESVQPCVGHNDALKCSLWMLATIFNTNFTLCEVHLGRILHCAFLHLESHTAPALAIITDVLMHIPPTVHDGILDRSAVLLLDVALHDETEVDWSMHAFNSEVTAAPSDLEKEIVAEIKGVDGMRSISVHKLAKLTKSRLSTVAAGPATINTWGLLTLQSIEKLHRPTSVRMLTVFDAMLGLQTNDAILRIAAAACHQFERLSTVKNGTAGKELLGLELGNDAQPDLLLLEHLVNVLCSLTRVVIRSEWDDVSWDKHVSLFWISASLLKFAQSSSIYKRAVFIMHELLGNTPFLAQLQSFPADLNPFDTTSNELSFEVQRDSARFAFWLPVKSLQATFTGVLDDVVEGLLHDEPNKANIELVAILWSIPCNAVVGNGETRYASSFCSLLPWLHWACSQTVLATVDQTSEYAELPSFDPVVSCTLLADVICRSRKSSSFAQVAQTFRLLSDLLRSYDADMHVYNLLAELCDSVADICLPAFADVWARMLQQMLENGPAYLRSHCLSIASAAVRNPFADAQVLRIFKPILALSMQLVADGSCVKEAAELLKHASLAWAQLPGACGIERFDDPLFSHPFRLVGTDTDLCDKNAHSSPIRAAHMLGVVINISALDIVKDHTLSTSGAMERNEEDIVNEEFSKGSEAQIEGESACDDAAKSKWDPIMPAGLNDVSEDDHSVDRERPGSVESTEIVSRSLPLESYAKNTHSSFVSVVQADKDSPSAVFQPNTDTDKSTKAIYDFSPSRSESVNFLPVIEPSNRVYSSMLISELDPAFVESPEFADLVRQGIIAAPSENSH